jgi:uncharacterized protein (TIRG00374 family)
VKRAILAVLFLATVIGAAVLVARIPGGVGPLVAMAGRIPAGHVAAIVGVTAIFYLLDWVRFASLLHLLGFRMSPALGLELVSVSYFVSTLTPTADLHLPAMIWLLARRGVDPGLAGAASITKSIYQVTWICVVALVSLAVTEGVRIPPAAAASLVVACVPLAVAVAFFVLCIAFPVTAARLTTPRPDRTGAVARFLGGFHSASKALAVLGRSTDRMHLLCHVASLAFIAAYVAIGWLMCDALGLSVSVGRAIPIFSASLMVAYLAPVPGSIGVTEVVTAYLIDPSLPPAALLVAGLLRFACWYVSVLPGAALLAIELLRARRAAPPRPSSGARP